jgi:hypothetical protein
VALGIFLALRVYFIKRRIASQGARKRRKALAKELQQKIKELIGEGTSIRKTAKALHVSTRTVRKYKGERPKTIQVALWLRVENNSKFVRGKSKARAWIEESVLSRYAMQKTAKDGYEYVLTIPYRTSKELDNTIYDILSEAESIADTKYCFTEADVRALDGSERSW